jgi:hypothetical protein
MTTQAVSTTHDPNLAAITTKEAGQVVVGDVVWAGDSWRIITESSKPRNMDGGPIPHQRRWLGFADGGGLDIWTLEELNILNVDAPRCGLCDEPARPTLFGQLIGAGLAVAHRGCAADVARDLADAHRMQTAEAQ